MELIVGTARGSLVVPIVTLIDTVNGSLWHRKHLKG